MTHPILSSWKRRRRIWVKTETNYSPFFKVIFATIYIYFSVQWIVDRCSIYEGQMNEHFLHFDFIERSVDT